MLLSLKWLSNFIDISDLDTETIVEKMVKCGFEVESVEKLGQGSNLVVGKIIECKDHPDSDHLHITKVDIGDEILDIVCGAPNCREGLKVIVAKVGAELPGGVIHPGVIRGQSSNGMLCSLKELGISEQLLPEDSPSMSGIEELDERFEVGEKNILDRLGYRDTILDVSTYPNRSDCLSMFAMAKEMAAILDRPAKLPEYQGKANIGSVSDFKLSSLSDNCPHFLAKVINKVKIKQSPDWMKEHLRANGIKCINNLVDISNYVMLETGQPLHFYDLRSIPSKEITVRDDYEGSYCALDGVEYQIEKGDLMITSQGKPIGIAGIMGGENTKILEDTKGLIIEAALFDSARIRRTSSRLGLQTEAASRFSKGLEPLAQNKAMDRAVDLLLQYADADELEETVEYGKIDYQPYEIKETISHLNSLIGKQYSMDEAISVIKRLDFTYRNDSETFYVTVPSYRANDLKIPVDLDEEIIRLTDFDNLKSTLPLLPQTVGKLSNIQNIRRQIRDFLVGQGLHETLTYTLVNRDYADNSLLSDDETIELLSPQSDARKYVRKSLMCSLLETMEYNLDHYNENVKLYEISKVYAKNKEEERLGIILEGNFVENKIKHSILKTDFYILKAILLDLLKQLGYAKERILIAENNLDDFHFHPYQSAIIYLDNKKLGIFGKLHPNYLKKWKLEDIFYAEIILNVLNESKTSRIKSPLISRFPAVSRDISLLLKQDILAADLLNSIKKIGGRTVKQATVFDVYEGEHIDKGYKSLSINIIYEDCEKTLKNDDVNQIHERILNEIINKYDAKQR